MSSMYFQTCLKDNALANFPFRYNNILSLLHVSMSQLKSFDFAHYCSATHMHGLQGHLSCN